MPEVQLKLVKNSADGMFGKAISNFNKVLFSPGTGFWGIVINSKRKALLKNYEMYCDYTKIADENKRNTIIKKYEKAYDAYLDMIEKYIKETLYTKAQKRISTLHENEVLSKYYEVMALKGIEYVEYKHKRQMLLLGTDWDMIVTSHNSILAKYKAFYLDIMEQEYKSIMRHYAVILSNAKAKQEDKYEKIYELIENYIKNVLPLKEQNDVNLKILDAYKKYITTIDVYAKKDYNTLKKEVLLLEMSRQLFIYSLPMVAAEQCYIKLIKEARVLITNTFIDADKFELYQLLLDIIESYNFNCLSQKVYWDKPDERDKYNEFWKQFEEIRKLQRIDFDEYKRKREILFVTYDIKMLNRSNKNYKEIKNFYRTRMLEIHGLRRLKNSIRYMDGVWRTRRRMKIQEDEMQND